MTDGRTTTIDDTSSAREREDEMVRYRRAMEGLVGIPATEGNRVTILHNGDEIFPAMLDAIRASESTIDFMTFVYWTGDIAEDFADALSDRAREGVRVRVLLDAIGARLMDRRLIDQMERAGVDVNWFRKPTTWRVWQIEHRTHRKILVCDEAVGFTGGVGIAEEWCGDARHPGEWRDTHFRVEGPAVDGLRSAFVSNWIETDEPLFDDRDRFPLQPQTGDHCVQVVRGEAGVGPTNLWIVMHALVCLARREINMTSAYFSPDPRFVRTMCEAVERGVRVRILVPGPHADKRVVQLAGEAIYEQCLDAGIELWNYQPTMLHAKVITVDGLVGLVGSANLNGRSMARDDEAGLVLFDEGLVGELDAHFEEDLSRSEEIHEARWRNRAQFQRAKERLNGIIDSRM